MKDNNNENTNSQPLAKSPEDARKRAFELVYQNWPGIIARFTNDAIGGSVQHAKFLQDWAEIASPTARKEPKEEKEQPPNLEAEFSLSQLLLDTLAAYDRGELKRG
jgi:hypothetical protein